jgi:hypothetical protein
MQLNIDEEALGEIVYALQVAEDAVRGYGYDRPDDFALELIDRALSLIERAKTASKKHE